MITAKIALQKFTEADFDIFYSLVKEDNVMRYITGKGLSWEAARKKFDSILSINREESEIGFFKVIDSDGVFLGEGKLERYPKDRSKLEVGYILKERFWGRGYGTLICAELLSLAERVGPTTDVVGIIDPGNKASKRLLEKFGFKSYFVGVEDNLPTEKLLLAKNIPYFHL